MKAIRSSVGRGGVNNRDDVLIVQQLINKSIGLLAMVPLKPLEEDSQCGPVTIAAIEAFQEKVLKMQRPDGRVDPAGVTFRRLLQGSGMAGVDPVAETANAMPVSLLSLSGKGLALLKAVEQLRLKPYDDQTGNEIGAWKEGATIGYGHLIKPNEWNIYKNGISEPDASALFLKDLAPLEMTVRSCVTATLAQNQFDSLVMLAFNIGPGVNGFAGSSVVKLINDPTAVTPFQNLEAAWKAWNKSQGQVMKGLQNRRQCEWDVYSKGIYKRW